MASRRLGWLAEAGPHLDHPCPGHRTDAAVAGFERATHLTHQRIETCPRVRLTVAGRVMSAALIESPRLDWRRDLAACRYRVVATPAGVTRAVRRLLAVLRLRHAAVEFAVDRSGRWWFLKVNPTPVGNRGPLHAKGGRGGA